MFGRAAALRCAEKLTAKARQPELPPDAGEETLARFDRLRNAKGGTPTSTLRLQMQRAMQSYATVFRTGSILQEGKEALREVWNGLSDIAVSDRSMIWNSDLVETLEFENLLLLATTLVDSAIARTESSRGSRARGFPEAGRPKLDETHARLGGCKGSRPVRLSPGTHVHLEQRHSVYRADGPYLLIRVFQIQRSPHSDPDQVFASDEQ